MRPPQFFATYKRPQVHQSGRTWQPPEQQKKSLSPSMVCGKVGWRAGLVLRRDANEFDILGVMRLARVRVMS